MHRNIGKPRTRSAHGNDKVQRDYSDTKEMLLDLLKVTGLISFAVVAPNGLRGYKFLLQAGSWFFQQPIKEQEHNLKKAIYYLKRQGYVTIETSGVEKFLKLMPKGVDQLKRMEVREAHFPVNKNWDQKWWIITADIPTKTHRAAADAFRAKLKEMKVVSLQRTLWVYPFEPTLELNFLLGIYDIGKFVTLMRADKLDTEDKALLLKHYKQTGLL